jgi:Ca2+/H+ antiporter
MEVMMTKVFKVCFTLAVFIGFYFFGYVTTAVVHTHFFQPEFPEQTLSIEEMAAAFAEHHADATFWETCEQEVE